MAVEIQDPLAVTQIIIQQMLCILIVSLTSLLTLAAVTSPLSEPHHHCKHQTIFTHLGIAAQDLPVAYHLLLQGSNPFSLTLGIAIF